jgi:hypothetical protein
MTMTPTAGTNAVQRVPVRTLVVFTVTMRERRDRRERQLR